MLNSLIQFIRLLAQPSVTYAWQTTPQSRDEIVTWLEENLDITNATLEDGDYVVIVRDTPSQHYVGDPFTILPRDIFHSKYRFVKPEVPGCMARVQPIR
jgi:hypothetical protein